MKFGMNPGSSAQVAVFPLVDRLLATLLLLVEVLAGLLLLLLHATTSTLAITAQPTAIPPRILVRTFRLALPASDPPNGNADLCLACCLGRIPIVAAPLCS